MPVTIHIEGTSAQHAFEEMRTLLAGDRTAKAEPAPTPAPLVAEEVPAAEEKTFPEPKRRGRPPKAVEPEVVEQPTVEAAAETDQETAQGAAADQETAQAEAPADEKPFTVDDARTALSDLLKQPDGKTKAQAVFAEMGCTKLSEIPEGSYKAFIAAIAKARGL